jgi:hypothetical protein
VDCGRCRARWRVRRVPGENFYLKLVAGGQRGTETSKEQSITAWYDQMKVGLALAPLATLIIGLHNDEILYLASNTVEMRAETGDPVFFPNAGDIDGPKGDKARINPVSLGRGRLYLTNRRLIWQAEAGVISFPLKRLNSAYAVVDFGLAVMVERWLYVVRFLEESPLKWVTYLGLVADQVEAESGHRIVTSHF